MKITKQTGGSEEINIKVRLSVDALTKKEINQISKLPHMSVIKEKVKEIYGLEEIVINYPFYIHYNEVVQQLEVIETLLKDYKADIVSGDFNMVHSSFKRTESIISSVIKRLSDLSKEQK